MSTQGQNESVPGKSRRGCGRRFKDRWLLTKDCHQSDQKAACADDRGLFERAALVLYRVLLCFAASWWLSEESDPHKRKAIKGAKRRARRRDPEAMGLLEGRRRYENRVLGVYVSLWLVVLILLLATNPFWAWLLAGLAAYRLAEMFTTGLGFVLGRAEPKLAGSLITVGMLALQTTLVFGILNQSLAADQLKCAPGCPSVDPFTFLYISWTDMTTLGNSYTPTSDGAQVLQMLATTSGLLILGILAARAITVLREPSAERP